MTCLMAQMVMTAMIPIPAARQDQEAIISGCMIDTVTSDLTYSEFSIDALGTAVFISHRVFTVNFVFVVLWLANTKNRSFSSDQLHG